MFDRHLGEFAALATACCWTVTALSFESAGRRVGSLAVNLIRLVLALGLLAIYCGVVRGHAWPTDATPTAWAWLGLSGFIGFALGDLCLFRAFVLIGSRVSSLLMSLVPPISVLIGWLALGEVLEGVEWLGMAITVAGVLLVVSERKRGENGPERLPLAGILLGIGAALGQAGGIVLAKIGMGPERYDPFAATQIRIIAGIVGFAVLFTGIRWWPRVFAACRDGAAMRRIGVGALFGPFLGVSLSLQAVLHTDIGVATTIMSIMPVLIIPPAILILRERVTARAACGAVLAVIGVGLLFQ